MKFANISTQAYFLTSRCLTEDNTQLPTFLDPQYDILGLFSYNFCKIRIICKVRTFIPTSYFVIDYMAGLKTKRKHTWIIKRKHTWIITKAAQCWKFCIKQTLLVMLVTNILQILTNILHLKTNTACDACDKYQIWASRSGLFYNWAQSAKVLSAIKFFLHKQWHSCTEDEINQNNSVFWNHSGAKAVWPMQNLW